MQILKWKPEKFESLSVYERAKKKYFVSLFRRIELVISTIGGTDLLIDMALICVSIFTVVY